MSRRLPALFIATVLLSLGGCASSQANTRTEPSTQAQASTSQPAMCGMCPMGVQGTQVAASDVEGGVALTFTTTTGDEGQLRSKVAQMAERHNTRPGMGMGPGMGMPMAAAKASMEEVPHGARLVLKAEDPAQVTPLREHVHRHAEMMAKGGCRCPGMHGAQGPQGSGS